MYSIDSIINTELPYVFVIIVYYYVISSYILLLFPEY